MVGDCCAKIGEEEDGAAMIEKRHPALMNCEELDAAKIPNNCYCQHVADAAARKVVCFLQDHNQATDGLQVNQKEWAALLLAVDGHDL